MIRDFKHTGAVGGCPMPPMPTQRDDLDALARTALLRLAQMTKDDIENLSDESKISLAKAMGVIDNHSECVA
jgi:hypothetical protein